MKNKKDTCSSKLQLRRKANAEIVNFDIKLSSIHKIRCTEESFKEKYLLLES